MIGKSKMKNAYLQVGIFHYALSDHTNKSHNIKNSNICEVTL